MDWKRFCNLLLLVMLVFTAGCQKRSKGTSSLEEWMAASDRIRVLSTTAMIDDLVGYIGGDRVVHVALISGEIDPHSYELVKGDDEKLIRAQVIFYNGLGLEHGASVRYQLDHHPHAIALGDAVALKYPDQIIHVDHEIDPHLWMDSALWSETIPSIVEGLAALSPESRSYFEENGKRLQDRMLQLHEEMTDDFKRIPESKRYLVTSHDAFNYFTRAYLATPEERAKGNWQQRFESPEGLAPDGQLGAYDIQQIVAHLAKYDIHVIFPESNVSRDSLKKIMHACEKNGFIVRISSSALYGDAMGPEGSLAHTYLNMLRHDADVLIHAWE